MYISGINGRGVFPDTRSELTGAVSHITTYTPDEPIQDTQHHNLLTWIRKAISVVPSTDTPPSPSAISPLPASSGSLSKRANPNTLTSVVAGVLVTAFVIFAGGFLYAYRRSIRFRQQARKSRRHRHRRRASGTSKISQASDAVGGGGDGGAEGEAPAADPAAQA